MQSEQHVIYRLKEGMGEKAQYDMEEIDGAHPSQDDCCEWKLTTATVNPQEMSTWR